MPITLKILQVKHGDAIIIECQQGDNRGVVVIDGGPQSTNQVFKDAIALYPSIDLLVLTHYDEDHIGGILSYVRTCRSENKPLGIKEIWANCASSIPLDDDEDLSTKQARKLSEILQEYVNEGSLVWRSDLCEGVIANLGFAKIHVVSPTREVLYKTLAGLQKEQEQEDLNLAAHSRQTAEINISLEELAKREKVAPDIDQPNQLANAASIAFILECDGTRLLMLGDSYSQNIVHYLTHTVTVQLPLSIDYVKVSHHGSRNNTSNELLDLIECQNYIISTNGGKGNTCHPDRETIANILCHPGRDRMKQIHLFFNYSKALVERCGAKFINNLEPQQYNFEIHDNITQI